MFFPIDSILNTTFMWVNIRHLTSILTRRIGLNISRRRWRSENAEDELLMLPLKRNGQSTISTRMRRSLWKSPFSSQQMSLLVELFSVYVVQPLSRDIHFSYKRAILFMGRWAVVLLNSKTLLSKKQHDNSALLLLPSLLWQVSTCTSMPFMRQSCHLYYVLWWIVILLDVIGWKWRRVVIVC